VRRRLGESTAWTTLALLIAFPGSIFFQFVYSESLFLLLTMLLFTGIDEECLGIATVAAFLLPLSRAVGLFCIFPILFFVLKENPPRILLRFGNVRRSIFDVPAGGTDAEPSRRRSLTVWHYCLVSAPLCGWAVYLLLMLGWTGNAFEGFAAQRQWGIQSVANIFDLRRTLDGFLHVTSWHDMTGSFLDRLCFLLILFSLTLIWRLDKAWFIWAVTAGVVPALSGTFVSYCRFSSVIFPAFVALSVAIRRRPILLWIYLIVFSAFHLILVSRFITYRWAG
jgi:hypothetical protein